MGKADIFVYGTLVNDVYVKIITGQSFQREKAVLPSFRKVTPAGGFPYIKPLPGVFVNGYILRGVDEESLNKLDDYEDEGFLYHRVAVKLWVGDKYIEGQTYVGNIENLKKFYHSKIKAETRVEKHLESKAEKIIKEEISERGLLDLIGLNTRMLKELRGQMVESVVLSAFEVSRPPDSVALNSLRNAGIPTLDKVKKDLEALKYADAYISFAVRHIIFNQIEEKVREDFRNEITVSEQFYIHAISNLVTLQFVN
ncbi:MAG: gamma-glutamylcyclotransferase family protein [Candidatus Theseobacter exili]|nr:gamma-glutamylcyclotransferase family protein [Candidatus Theseobacter exili]